MKKFSIRTLLPEERNYAFESIDVISQTDENGEIKIDIVGEPMFMSMPVRLSRACP